MPTSTAVAFPDDDLVSGIIQQALVEDIGTGDHTSLACFPETSPGKALLRAKQQGVVAGVELAQRIFKAVDPDIFCEILVQDGQRVSPGTEVMHFTGEMRSILSSERLALNFMQRLSGIATLTRKMVDAIKGTEAVILDTRKTTPNLRMLEKWAVLLGGARNHRFGLYDVIMIKDNHVDACGGIAKALERVHAYLNRQNLRLDVIIETRTLEEVMEVVNAGGASRILLDNFSPAQLREAVIWIDGRVSTEASGNITLENVRAYAETGVEFISTGAITHSAGSLDFSLMVSS